METTILKQFIQQVKEDNKLLVTGLNGSAKAYVLAKAFEKNQQTLCVVTANMLQATQLYDDFNALLTNGPVYLYASEESIAAEFAFGSKEIMAQRIEVLQKLTQNQPIIVVTPLAGVRSLLAPRSVFEQYQLQLSVGNDIDLQLVQQQLVTMGYVKEAMVESPGQFSVRGGIIDIYDIVSDKAYRIELFDTEVDSIRIFNPENQKSIESIEQMVILPAIDVLFDAKFGDKAVEQLEKTLSRKIPLIKNETLQQSTQTFFEHLLSRWNDKEYSEQTKLYTNIFYKTQTTLLDYLNESAIVVIDEYARLLEQEKTAEEEEVLWQVHQMEQAILLPDQQLKKSFKEQLKVLTQRTVFLSHLQKGLGRMQFSAVLPFQYRSIPQFFSQMPLIKTEFERYEKQGMTTIVVVSDEKRREKVSQTFDDFGIKNVQTDFGNILATTHNIVIGQLHSGFELANEKLAVLNERELFNKINKPIAKRQNLSNAERLKSYSELKPGDFVVHVSHGVGKYKGMETLEIGGVKNDYMSIVYEDDSSIYVPIAQIHLVQKYVASDGKPPKLNKLGGAEWAKTKRKVAQKIEDIADELIELYAKREAEIGFAFSKDTPDQKAFENAFAYSETPDQLRSVVEIKRDMEKPKPMDRLLVGDVGYGKTEVAMRAIFKAVQDGKQVAFLVPTTVLAQQHYLTLTQRFEDFGVTIGLLSRFRTKSQQEETITGVAKGYVDVVVGTHRVLSSDLSFKDLGLIIIDEEQRFGVKHKEKLKQLKSEIDVLTLTATPIPRTLHMSMLGVRDLSVIETPPANRYPVQTYVMEQNYDVVRDAIDRELGRNGQVFYLYNRVDRIQEKANLIANLVPHARVAVAHGQMSEVALENVLMAFMAGDYDVLVTTTIVETGVDLPNVNTLFIEDADKMGLSTLYQLRGRVGRTNRVAYAYLMHQADKSLTETGEKRLEAIKEFTQLGAGFKIAMRDLSIRGAGNLLGKQQSGFIDSVGFDLYSQMLEEAVSFKKTGKVKTVKTVEIDLAIDAYIPSYYVSDERQKIDLYKRIRSIQSLEDFHQIQDDFIDRFGDYPEEVSHIMQIGLIKWYAQEQDVEKIKRVANKIFVTFSVEKSKQLFGPKVFEQLSKTKLKAMIQNENQKLIVVLDVKDRPSDLWLDEIKKYLAVENGVQTQIDA